MERGANCMQLGVLVALKSKAFIYLGGQVLDLVISSEYPICISILFTQQISYTPRVDYY